MSQYTFVTHWKFNAPLENVWNEIRDMDSWPDWWKFVKSVEIIRQGDMKDIGTMRRIVWTTALPYQLSFESELISLEPYHRIEGRAYGELTGIGIWSFESIDKTTSVRYDWIVSTSKKWMNFIAPIARPLFRWNHDKVMSAGYTGLKTRLNLKANNPG